MDGPTGAYWPESIGADLSQVQGEAGQAAQRLTTAGLQGQRVRKRRGQLEREWTAERQLDFLAVALFLLTLAEWSKVLVDEKILFKLQCWKNSLKPPAVKHKTEKKLPVPGVNYFSDQPLLCS